jgi:hypothetical protein
MSGKLYCLNTRCYTTVLMMVSANYSRHHNELAKTGKGERMHKQLLETPLIPFDATRAVAFVHAMTKANLSSYLAYSKGDTQSDVMAKLMFGDDTRLTNGTLAWVNDFMTVVEVDDTYLDIDMRLGQFLKRDTWAIVDTYDMGHSLSIVVQEDMRIREWNQMKGSRAGIMTPTIDLDLSEMFSYLRIKTNQLLKPVDMHYGDQIVKVAPGEHIDFKPIVLDMLLSRYPFLRKDGQVGTQTDGYEAGTPKNKELLIAAGLVGDGVYTTQLNDEAIRSVHDYIDRLVTPVVTSYSVMRFMGTLDNLSTYTVEISSDERLVVIRREEEATYKVNDNARITELVESYLRGDRLPPNERDEAERWVMDNQ